MHQYRFTGLTWHVILVEPPGFLHSSSVILSSAKGKEEVQVLNLYSIIHKLLAEDD